MIKLNISDNDIKFSDERSGDIVVPTKYFKEQPSQQDVITVHFDEDDDHVSHQYKFVEEVDDGYYLMWVEMLEEELLTEAPTDRSMSKAVKKGLKKAEKAEKKQNKNFAALIKRELTDGVHCKFYLQCPNGKYTDALKFADVKPLYNAKDMSPAIVNAIVTTGSDHFLRKGKQDYEGLGISKSEEPFTVEPQYAVNWDDDSIDNFTALLDTDPSCAKIKEAVKKACAKSTSKSTSKEDKTKNKTVSDKASDTTSETSNKETSASTSGKVTDKLLKKFELLAKETGIKILDKDLKELGPSDKIYPDRADEYYVMIRNKEQNLLNWLRSASAKGLITESFTAKNLFEEILDESPIVTLSDDDVNNPDSVNFKDITKRAIDTENQQIQLRAKEQRKAELKAKAESFIPEFDKYVNSNTPTTDTIEFLFDKLVPSQGPAESVGGEHVRAIMRILYRDANDGDLFYEGYGLETCGSSAEYLRDNGYKEDIDSIMEQALSDQEYTDAIMNIAEDMIKQLYDHKELMWEPNEEDSRDYSYEYMKDNQPTYEFEIYASDAIKQLVDAGTLTSWDLIKYVENELEYESAYTDANVARPWGHHDTSVTVENLTREGYDLLSDIFNHNPERFWEDLVNEYTDELESLNTVDDDFDM